MMDRHSIAPQLPNRLSRPQGENGERGLKLLTFFGSVPYRAPRSLFAICRTVALSGGNIYPRGNQTRSSRHSR